MNNLRLCGSSWGIGMYVVRDENGKAEQVGYGLYKPQDPNDFIPDPESCTEQEIANWNADKESFNKGVKNA